MKRIVTGFIFLLLICIFVNSALASTITNVTHTWVDYTYQKESPNATIFTFTPQWGSVQVLNITNFWQSNQTGGSGRIWNDVEFVCENSSDIALAFTIITDKLTTCMMAGQNMTTKILDCREQAKFESNFTACLVDLNNKQDENSILSTSWQKKYDDLNNQKFWIMMGAIIGGVYFFYDFVIVKKGKFSLKREERTAFPKEGSF